MRAKQFIPETNIGTNPKRPSRTGSRPERGHEPQSTYKENVAANGIGTMPTTEYVKGIYAAAAENGLGAPQVDAVKKQMVLAPNGEVDIMATMQKALQVFHSPEFKQLLADLDALIKRAEAQQSPQMESIGEWLVQERGKASRALCTSSKPDADLGASNLASCKSQGLRARDGEKSHLIGHGGSKVRVTVGGKKIKGAKYGGPLPDFGTRKGQK